MASPDNLSLQTSNLANIGQQIQSYFQQKYPSAGEYQGARAMPWNGSVIVFPNGERIDTNRLFGYFFKSQYITLFTPVDGKLADSGELELATWMSFIQRPPILDEEILLMSDQEVVELYYSLKKGAGCSVEEANKPISNGITYFFIGHEDNLQRRIWNLRPDLRKITYKGRSYRLLMNPDEFNKQLVGCTPPLAVQIINAAIFAVLGAATGGIGWAATISLTAAQAYQTIDSRIEAVRKAAKAEGISKEIATGYAVVSVNSAPTAQSQMIGKLADAYARWQVICDQLDTQEARQWLRRNYKRLYGPIAKIIGSYGHTSVTPVDNYLKYYKPYRKFFYNKRISDLVSSQINQTSQPISSPAETTPEEHAVGLGLLLLLLL